MPKPRYHQNITVTIQHLGKNGEGVGYWHGYTLFIPKALLGEVVRARIVERNRSYGRAQITEVLQPSCDRIKPICPHFDLCGGCQLMQIPYENQLAIKQEKVKKAFEEASLPIEIPQVIPSPEILHYRNKIQVPVENRLDNPLSIGMYSQHTKNLVPIQTCLLHTPVGEDILQKTISLLKLQGFVGFDPSNQTGEIRSIFIREIENEAFVVFVTFCDLRDKLSLIAQQLMKEHKSIKGVWQNVNSSLDNRVLSNDYLLLEGKENIEAHIENLICKITPSSFFQINFLQMKNLYQEAIHLLDPLKEDVILDGFCGIGILSLLIAQKVKKVIGCEYVDEAIQNAIQNAKNNSIQNVQFYPGDMTALIDTIDPFNKALLNPPRKGCDQALLEKLIKRKVQTIVYISCEPQSLAKDIHFLIQNGYELHEIKLFDMFPQTYHVETVVKLVYKG
jgi:23S rRNA (uracil1939-C5)-methyltransferase